FVRRSHRRGIRIRVGVEVRICRGIFVDQLVLGRLVLERGFLVGRLVRDDGLLLGELVLGVFQLGGLVLGRFVLERSQLVRRFVVDDNLFGLLFEERLVRGLFLEQQLVFGLGLVAL